MPNIATIIACCCVLDIVEMKSPKPKVDKIKTNDAAKRKRKSPRTAIPNQKTIKEATIKKSIKPIITNGISFPIIS